MVSTLDYAELANYVYFDTRSEVNRPLLPTGWTDISQEFSDYTSSFTGFHGGVFKNADGDVVISFEGTNANPRTKDGAGDWTLGNPLGIGVSSPQLFQAAILYEAVSEKYQKISLTGHSLGGGLASLISAYFDVPATTFDLAPFKRALNTSISKELGLALSLRGYFKDAYKIALESDWDKLGTINDFKINSYSLNGEVLEDLRKILPTIGPLPEQTTIGDEGVDAVTRHSILLLLAAKNIKAFAEATLHLADLVPEIFDKNLYSKDLADRSGTDFLVRLVDNQFGGTNTLTGEVVQANGMLDRFSADLLKLGTGNRSLQNFTKALIAASIEYYNFLPATSKVAFFNQMPGGVSFDLSSMQVDSGFALKSPAMLIAAAEAMTSYAAYEDIEYADKWFVQSGTTGLNASAVDASSGVVMIGGSGGNYLVGGIGNDVLVGGSGDDTLKGGGGDNYLQANFDDNVLYGNGLYDEFYLVSRVDNYDSILGYDTIYDATGDGEILVNGTQLTGTTDVALGFVWVDDESGTMYTYDSKEKTLTIKNGILADSESVLIKNFDLAAAESGEGYLGIKFNGKSAVAADSNVNPLATGNYQLSDVTTSAKGVTQSVTVFASAISDSDQTVKLFLNGANASDFKLTTGAHVFDFSNGVLTLTIPAGTDKITVGLIYTGTSESNVTAKLTSDVGGDGVADSNVLSVTYVGIPPAEQPTNQITGEAGSATDTNGQSYDLMSYTGDDGNDEIVTDDMRSSVVNGTAGNDRIVAGTGSDTIYTGNGNSTISGGTGADIIHAGNGNNEIYEDKVVDLSTALSNAASQPTATGRGTAIVVGDGNNTIVAGNGNDALILGHGSNTVVLGNGSVSLVGGATQGAVDPLWTTTKSGYDVTFVGFGGLNAPGSNDWLIGAGSDTIYGGAGDSYFWLANGNNFVDLGGGNDNLTGGTGNDTIYGSSGNNRIFGSDGGNMLVYAESGDNLIVGEGANITVYGGTGNNDIYAGTNQDGWATSYSTTNYLFAGTGNTRLWGANGHDTLIGGSGKDTLVAGDGTEYIEAGSGDTSINGGAGDDTIIGGSGIDTIHAGNGTAHISAGNGGVAGNETIVTAGNGATTIIGGAGVDLLYGGAGTNVIYAGDGGTAEEATYITAGTGDTTIYGGGGIDYITGGAGSTLIYAGDGGTASNYTQVYAGSGQATLYGGAGYSALVAGSGNDTLVAGTGTTEFDGGGGSAVFQVNANSGDVTIFRDGAGDILQFGEGIAAEDVSIIESIDLTAGVTYQLTLANGSTVTIAPGGMTSAKFADGSVVTFQQLIDYTFTVGDPYGDNTSYTSVSATMNQVSSGASGASPTSITQTVFARGDADISITGNNVNNVLTANNGNDTLVAGTANSTLIGGGLSDEYVVGAGAGTVTTIQKSSARDVLSFAAGVILADLNASTALDSSGALQVTLTNSSGGSVVIDAGLPANDGHLDQIAFADGSTASLEEIVAHLTTGATAATSEIDTTLGTGVENMTLTGTANLTVTGNALDNVIAANSGNDTLIAGTGASDTLVGGAGANSYVVGQGNSTVTIANSGVADTLVFGSGILQTGLSATSAVVGGVTVVTLSHNDSDGSVGTVIVQGGDLAKVTFADGTSATLGELLGTAYTHGTTTYSSVSATASDGVAKLVMTGDASVTATANDQDMVIQSNSGSDTLVAGSGNDTLIGGGYSDTYVVAAGPQSTTVTQSSIYDTLQYGAGVSLAHLNASVALAADGTPTITIQNSLGGSVVINAGSQFPLDMLSFADGSTASLSALIAQATTGVSAASSAIDVTLGANVQNMLLTGTAALTATGNGLDNVITANAGNDTLIAGSGANDTLRGGGGVATFIVNQGGSTVVVDNSGAADVLSFGSQFDQSSVLASSAMVNGVRQVTLSVTDIYGDVAKVVVHGGLDQVSFGNGGVVTLEQLLAPSYSEGATMYSAVSATASADVTNLIMTGSADVVASGNSQANVIRANSGNDTLIAGTGYGYDTLIGGGASDTYKLSGNFQYTTIEQSGSADTIVFDSSMYPSYLSAFELTDSDGSTMVELKTAFGGEIDIKASNRGSIDKIVFSDGSVESLQEVLAKATIGLSATTSDVSVTLGDGIQNMLLTGSENLVVYGNALDNVISANDGSDTLVAGTGQHDTLNGGSSTTYFRVNQGGSEIVVNGSDSDVLMFGPGISESSMVVTKNPAFGNDAVTIHLVDGNGVGGDVILPNGELGKVVFSDGTVVTLDQLLSGAYSHGESTYSQVSTTEGAGIDKLFMTGSADVTATANALDSLLQANSGNDTLIAGTGKDTLVGGGLSDTYVLAAGTQTTRIEKSGAADTLQFAVGTKLADLSVSSVLVDGSLTVTIDSSSGGVVVIKAGDAGMLDTLRFADGSTGSLGQLLARLSSGATAATSSQSVQLADGIQNMQLTGSADLLAVGNSQDNVITANSGNDTLVAGSGRNDTLSGGGGTASYAVFQGEQEVLITNSGAADTLMLVGGTTRGALTTSSQLVDGVRVVTLSDGAGGTVVIQGGGLDKVEFDDGSTATLEQLLAPSYTDGTTLYSNVSTAMRDGVTTLIITGGDDVMATANGLNDTIVANLDGNDTLVAGTGNDTLVGGGRADTYVMAAGSQLTTIEHSTAADTLKFGAGVSLTDLSASAALDADGVMVVTVRNALGGSVAITSGAGGLLNQISFADGSTASLSTLLAQATTGLSAAISGVSVVLGNGIQNMTLTGSANLTATGNALDNVITANSGNDVLQGGTGNDTLVAGAGNDTLIGGANAGKSTYMLVGPGNDSLIAGAGPTVFDGGTSGGSATYLVKGGSGPVDIVHSGSADTLQFGAGINVADITLSSSVDVDGVTPLLKVQADGASVAIHGGDPINFALADGNVVTREQLTTLTFVDGQTQYTSSGGTLDASLSGMVLTGGADLVARGNDGDNLIIGNKGNDTLISGSGQDTLVAGGGHTTFVVNNSADLILGAPSTGGNAVISSVSYVLANNVNDLTLTGSTDLAGFGSNVAGVITANSGNDILVGGSGGDTLVGGAGNDLLVGGTGSTTYQLNLGGGADTIRAGLNGTDTLSFGSGVTLADLKLVYTGGSSQVVLQIGANGDQVTLDTDFTNQISSFKFADGTHLSTQELLDQVSTNALAETGSGQAVILTGGSGKDTLDGGSGNATLIGGAGNDTYVFGRQSGFITVLETTGQSSAIALGAGVALSDLRMQKMGNDLQLSIVGSTGTLLLPDYFTTSQSWNALTSDGQSATLGSLYQAEVEREAGLSTQQRADSYATAFENAMRANVASLYGAASGADGAYVLPTGDDTVHDTLSIATLTTNGADYYLDSGVTDPNTYSSTELVTDHTVTSTYKVAITPDAITTYLNAETVAALGTVGIAGLAGSGTMDSSGGIYLTQTPATVYKTVTETYTYQDVTVTDQQYGLTYQIEHLNGNNANSVIDYYDRSPSTDGVNGQGFANGGTVAYFDTPLATVGSEIIHTGDGDVLVDSNDFTSYVYDPDTNTNYGTLDPFSAQYEAATFNSGGLGSQDVSTAAGFGIMLNPVQFRDALAGSGNFIEGGTGNDTLLGGFGGDMIIAGSGDSLLNGGGGADTYVALAGEKGWSVVYDSGEEMSVSDLANAKTFVSKAGTVTFSSQNGETTFTTGAETYVVTGHTDYNNTGIGKDGFYQGSDGQWYDYGGTWQGYEVSKAVVDTVAFDAGITLANLTFSWGVVDGDSLHQTLNIGWGNDSGYRIAVANANDPGDFGVEQFTFADGTVMTMAQMQALAPPRPGAFDAAPTLTAALTAQSYDARQSFNYVIPTHTFLDQNIVDTVQYALQLSDGSALPSWLRFDAATNTLSSTGTGAVNGVFNIKVTGTDYDGLSSSTTFALTVSNAGTVADGFNFHAGMGQQTLASTENLVRFSPGIAPANLKVTRDGLDLLVADGADVLRIAGWYANPPRAGSLSGAFSDGSAWDKAAATQQGLTLVDTLGNTTLRGLDNYANVLVSGANDTLLGGAAGNIFVVAAGDGVVHITASGSGNTLRFGSGINAADVTLVSGSVLTLQLDGAGDQVQIAGFDPANPQTSGTIQNFAFADGTVLTYAQLLARGFDIHVGAGNVSVAGGALNERIYAGSGNDTIYAGAGNDTLIAGAGVDSLLGGAGDDTYVITSASDVVVEGAGQGTDTVQVSFNYVLSSGVENLVLGGSADLAGTGNALNNSITGNAGNDTLAGGSGADTLVAGSGVATMQGGIGDDLYIVNNVADVIIENAGEGSDVVQASVSYVIPANVESLVLTGSADLTATGGAGNDVLTGNAGHDTLIGGAGNDKLITGAGLATLMGGVGNDIYVVNNSADVIVEQSGEGNDSISSSINYVMPENVEMLTLTGSADLTASGNDMANTIVGNAGNDTLTAGTGNTTLSAGAGLATLIGGIGNNVFFVNNVNDVIIEQANAGTDSINASVNYVLPANVENLVLTGSANLIGTGNDGNSALFANAGNDTLRAGTGNTWFYASTGVATMVGGLAYNYFNVNNAADVVVAQAGAVLNTVNSTINYVMGDNVRVLNLKGTTGLTATGNALNDTITASTGNDTLYAGSGNATLAGGTGVDALVGGAGNDLLTDLTGKGGLWGGAGNDKLSVAGANSFVAGGLGNDTVSLGATASVLAFNAGDGADTVTGASGAAATLSLGGGIDYGSLSFAKSGNDLVLKTGGDSVTLQGWYAATALHDITTLQIAEVGNASYDANSSNALYNSKVEEFDFAKLAAQFDQARAASPALSSWNLMDGLLSAHLSGSDTAAIGGDMAYAAATQGTGGALNLGTMVATLQDTQYGKAGQALHA